MGQLLRGRTLSWKETKNVAASLRKAAAKQLIESYKKNHNVEIRPISSIRWGYEIEFIILKLDNSKDSLVPFPCADEVLNFLNSKTETQQWNPEYASFMVECVPQAPFLLETDSLGNTVFEEMKNQRKILEKSLVHLYGSTVVPCSIGSFPLLGAEPQENKCPHSLSHLFPSNFINSHPRFATLTRNIVERRNNLPVDIHIPAYQDTNTKIQTIQMDAMGFGMGCCCLQTTTEMESFEDACCIYDELLSLAPIALALTASSPVFCGLLSGQDTRWKVLESAVDDRSKEEIAKNILSSRYSPSKIYISQQNKLFNDVETHIHLQSFNSFVTDGNMPENFAWHYAHIFYRDPLIAYEGIDYEDPSPEDGAFIDALQSTNWNSVRFKVPSSGCGWRIEFRPMEVQPTDFENCAFSIFIEGIIFALMQAKKLGDSFSFVIPISDVQFNFSQAVQMDAVTTLKFKWMINKGKLDQSDVRPLSREISLYSIDEIVNNSETGLLSFIEHYVPKFYSENRNYLELVRQRAAGMNATPAKRIRNLVLEHPDYKNDSIVTNSIMKSILKLVNSE